MTVRNSAVTRTAAAHAGDIRAANVEPGTRSRASTRRFVRFDPGSRSDAAFDMNTHPYRNGRSSAPRLRAAASRIGVRKTTDVSRLRTTVTPATTPRRSQNRTRSDPPTRAIARPADTNTPSSAATAPISRRPATRTNGGQA
jgi:hypothetical protein